MITLLKTYKKHLRLLNKAAPDFQNECHPLHQDTSPRALSHLRNTDTPHYASDATKLITPNLLLYIISSLISNGMVI